MTSFLRSMFWLRKGRRTEGWRTQRVSPRRRESYSISDFR